MGGSSKGGSVTVGYRYYFDIHFGLGLPIDELVSWKAGGATVWTGSITSNGSITINRPDLFGGDSGEGGLQGQLQVMFGDEDQTAPQGLLSMLGPYAPHFRGFSSGFYSGLVTSLNPYPKQWEFLRRGGNRLWGEEGAWYPEKQFIWLEGGQVKAMNPVHMLYMSYVSRLLRRNPWPRSWMDDAAWRAAADTCFDEGFGLCMEWRRSDSMSGFRDVVKSHVGAEIFDDPQTGLCSIALLRGDYDPQTLPLFDEDSGLLELQDDESTAIDMAPSEIIIKYVDARTGKTKTVRVVNSALAARNGGGSAEEIEYSACPTGELAARIAQRDMKVRSTGLKRYKLVLDRRARSIHPGSVFRIRSLKRGIQEVVVRAGKVDTGKLLDGRITVDALQDVFGLPSSSFVEVPPIGWTPPDKTPAVITEQSLFEVPYFQIARTLDPYLLDNLDGSEAWVASMAVEPNPMQWNYELITRVGAAGNFTSVDTGDWTPRAALSAPVGRDGDTLMLVDGYRLDEVVVGESALLNGELLIVTALDIQTGECLVERGCGDTIPAQHLAGDEIWFFEAGAGVDPTEYSSGLTIEGKLLSKTSEASLDENLASVVSIDLLGRAGRPYPPANVQLNGEYWPSEVVGDIDLSWAHRDRISQSDVLVPWTDGDIGPEPGTSYQVTFLQGVSQVLQDTTTETSFPLVPPADGQYTVTLVSRRDGLDSWQTFEHTFSWYRTEPMATEAGEIMLTESGEEMIVE